MNEDELPPDLKEIFDDVVKERGIEGARLWLHRITLYTGSDADREQLRREKEEEEASKTPEQREQEKIELRKRAEEHINRYKQATDSDFAYLAGMLESSRGMFGRGVFSVFYEGGRSDKDVWKLMEHLQETFGPITHTADQDIWWQPLDGIPSEEIYKRCLPYFKTRKHLEFKRPSGRRVKRGQHR